MGARWFSTADIDTAAGRRQHLAEVWLLAARLSRLLVTGPKLKAVGVLLRSSGCLRSSDSQH